MDEISPPEWASAPLRGEEDQYRPEWYEAVAMVERAARILDPDEDAVYTGQRLGENVALALLDAMQNSTGGTLAQRVRLMAQVMEIYARRRGAGRRPAPPFADEPEPPGGAP